MIDTALPIAVLPVNSCVRPGGRTLRAHAARIAPATHVLLDRLEDALDGRAPADMFKRYGAVRSLYG